MSHSFALFSEPTDGPLREFQLAVRAAARQSYPGADADLNDPAYHQQARDAVPSHPFRSFPVLVGKAEGGVAVQMRDAAGLGDGVPEERDGIGGTPEDVRLQAVLVVHFRGNAEVLRYRPCSPARLRPWGGSSVAEPGGFAQVGGLPRGRVFQREGLIRLPLRSPVRQDEVDELCDVVARNIDKLRHEASMFFNCVSGASIIDGWKEIRDREKLAEAARRKAAAGLHGVRVIG